MTTFKLSHKLARLSASLLSSSSPWESDERHARAMTTTTTTTTSSSSGRAAIAVNSGDGSDPLRESDTSRASRTTTECVLRRAASVPSPFHQLRGGRCERRGESDRPSRSGRSHWTAPALRRRENVPPDIAKFRSTARTPAPIRARRDGESRPGVTDDFSTWTRRRPDARSREKTDARGFPQRGSRARTPRRAESPPGTYRAT